MKVHCTYSKETDILTKDNIGDDWAHSSTTSTNTSCNITIIQVPGITAAVVI